MGIKLQITPVHISIIFLAAVLVAAEISHGKQINKFLKSMTF